MNKIYYKWMDIKLCPICGSDIIYHLDSNGNIDDAICSNSNCNFTHPSKLNDDSLIDIYNIIIEELKNREILI